MEKFNLNLRPKVLSPSDVGNILFDYFKNLSDKGKTPTVAGLALELNIPPKKLFAYADDNIDSIDENEQEKAQLISRALAFIAEHYETGGDEKKNSTFNWNILKALGYPEKTVVDLQSKGESLVSLAKKANELRNINPVENNIDPEEQQELDDSEEPQESDEPQ